MIPDQFAVIRPESERKADRFDQAVEVLRSGVANGVVRNKGLQDAKSMLGAAVYDAWQKTVSSPFFWAGKYEEQSEEINLVNPPHPKGRGFPTPAFLRRRGGLTVFSQSFFRA